VSVKFEILTILTLENTVLINVALYKCAQFSKDCYASIFSLSDIHYDSILQSTSLFIYRNLPKNNWILLQMCQISSTAYHTEYMNVTKIHTNISVWTENLKWTDYLEVLSHRWKLGLTERPTKYSLHLSKLLIPTVSSVSCDVTLFYRLTCNRMVLLTSQHSRRDFQDWRRK